MSSPPVRVSPRVQGFSYAIRNIVAEARKVEAAGRRVRYLNIGDPIPFGFKTPPHLIEAVARAMRDGHNGYTASAGIEPARIAVADDYSRRGMPVSPDRVKCRRRVSAARAPSPAGGGGLGWGYGRDRHGPSDGRRNSAANF